VRGRRKKEFGREKRGGISKGKRVFKIDDGMGIDLEEGMDALESVMESGFHGRVYLSGLNTFV
jgi:hypothetical protein